MIHNQLGNTDFTTSRMGFGFMRPPTKELEDGTKATDEEQAIKNIRHAIDNGVNYVDTAYGYVGNEVLLGKALKDGYREKVNITTKSSIWRVEKPEDFDIMFNEQLERLQVDYIDTYIFHNVRPNSWKAVVDHGGIEFMEKLKAQGKIKRIGFSFHAEYDFFEEVVDYYDWDFCMIQFNILDQKHQAGLKGLKYAKSKGLAVAVMEPLKGGLLSQTVPEEVQELMKDHKTSLADLCLRWVSNFVEVDVVVSGITNFSDIEENLKTFKDLESNRITDDELELVERVIKIYENQLLIKCSECGYCMPCPAEVNIPSIIKVHNDASMSKWDEFGKVFYEVLIKGSNGEASKCTECGICEGKCPQDIPIIETLKSIVELYEE